MMDDESLYIDERMCRGEHLFRLTKPSQMQSNIMHKCIGALLFKTHSPNQVMIPGFGTGFLISANLVLTAAHNIYNSQTDTVNQDLKFYPGACGKLGYAHEVEQFRFLLQEMKESKLAPKKAYRNSKNVSYDYALLKLAVPVQKNVYLKLGLFFEQKVNYLATNLAIFGYPYSLYENRDRKGDHIETWQAGLQREGRILPPDPDSAKDISLEYEISTQGGQSGAPVIIGQGKYEVVVGIHKAGRKSKNCNIARLITLDMLGVLEKWRKSMKGQAFEAYNLMNRTLVPEEMMDLGEKLFHFDKETIEMTFNYLAEKIEKINTSVDCGLSDKEKAKMMDMVKRCQQNMSMIGINKLSDELFVKTEIITSKIRETGSSIYSTLSETMKKPTSHSQLSPPPLSPQLKADLQSLRGEMIEWDKQSITNHSFYVDGKRATRMSSGSWSQILSTTPVKNNSTYMIKVVKFAGKSSFFCGLVIADKKTQKWNNFKKDSVAYWSWIKFNNWQVYVGGEKEDSGTEGALKQGGVLRIHVNLTKPSVTFVNEETGKQSELALPPKYHGKDLYLFTSLFEKGTAVELIY